MLTLAPAAPRPWAAEHTSPVGPPGEASPAPGGTGSLALTYLSVVSKLPRKPVHTFRAEYPKNLFHPKRSRTPSPGKMQAGHCLHRCALSWVSAAAGLRVWARGRNPYVGGSNTGLVQGIVTRKAHHRTAPQHGAFWVKKARQRRRHLFACRRTLGTCRCQRKLERAVGVRGGVPLLCTHSFAMCASYCWMF